MRYLLLINMICCLHPLMAVSDLSNKEITISVSFQPGDDGYTQTNEISALAGITIADFKKKFWHEVMATEFKRDPLKPLLDFLDVYYQGFPLPDAVEITEPSILEVRPKSEVVEKITEIICMLTTMVLGKEA